MPDFHFWMICLRAFLVAFAGAMTTQLVQLSGTNMPIAGTTWLTAGLAGVLAATNAGHAAWPETPVPAAHVKHRRRHVRISPIPPSSGPPPTGT